MAKDDGAISPAQSASILGQVMLSLQAHTESFLEVFRLLLNLLLSYLALFLQLEWIASRITKLLLGLSDGFQDELDATLILIEDELAK